MIDNKLQPQPIEPTLPPSQGLGFFGRHQRSIWLSLLTIALAVAALLAYILFFQKPAPEPEYTGNVRMEISAPEESVSGSEIYYTLTINNLSETRLTKTTLEMFYPPGFTFLRSQPPQDSTEGAENRIFPLTDLPRGGEQKLVIVGRLEGNVQEIKTVKAKLRYVPENFNSFFLAEAEASVVILPPNLTIRALGPSMLISGQMIEYEIEIRNISIDDFDNLSLELSYPPGFNFIEASPAPVPNQEGERDSDQWLIGSLPSGSTKTIAVKGRMMTPPGEEVYLAAELFTSGEEGRLSAGRSYIFTRMVDSPLLLTHKLIGGESTLFGGEKLQYEINYENIGEIGLSNVAIALKFESTVFDLVKSGSTSGQIRGREMVWLPAAVPELRTVHPNQRGKFTVQVPIKSENLLTQKNPVAQTRMQFSADEISEPIAGQALTLKIGTNMNLAASVILISGPEDPDIGQTSVYQVTLTLKNSVNDVENAELTGRLPGSTVTLDEASLAPVDERGNIEYIPEAGLLRWRLGKVFAYSGTVHSPRTISFRMSITPEKKISGAPLLLADVEATGIDSFTGEQIFSNNLEEVEGE